MWLRPGCGNFAAILQDICIAMLYCRQKPFTLPVLAFHAHTDEIICVLAVKGAEPIRGRLPWERPWLASELNF